MSEKLSEKRGRLIRAGFFHRLDELIALRILGGSASFALSFNEIVNLSVLLTDVLFFEKIPLLGLVEISFRRGLAVRTIQTVLIHAGGVVVKVTLEILHI